MLVSICLMSSNIIQGQSYCPPKGITTNPGEPINTLNPSMINDFSTTEAARVANDATQYASRKTKKQ